ncbi:MAG: GNAT family N-acetyltransferase [Ruminococcus sp.]|nr:GNAT family N-acetyltransferase [Ruminococcus sp.]
MKADDRDEVIAMMRVFYDSPAVIHKSSDEILMRDFDDCVGDTPFLRGFMLEFDGDAAGYAMVSLGYTTEYGGVCVWLEDLYIKPEYRRFGIASELLAYIEREFPDAVRFKLEVEQENEPAYACYFRGGYRMSDYGLMTKENV